MSGQAGRQSFSPSCPIPHSSRTAPSFPMYQAAHSSPASPPAQGFAFRGFQETPKRQLRSPSRPSQRYSKYGGVSVHTILYCNRIHYTTIQYQYVLGWYELY